MSTTKTEYIECPFEEATHFEMRDGTILAEGVYNSHAQTSVHKVDGCLYLNAGQPGVLPRQASCIRPGEALMLFRCLKLKPEEPIEFTVNNVVDCGHVIGTEFHCNGDRFSDIPESWHGKTFREVTE